MDHTSPQTNIKMLRGELDPVQLAKERHKDEKYGLNKTLYGARLHNPEEMREDDERMSDVASEGK